MNRKTIERGVMVGAVAFLFPSYIYDEGLIPRMTYSFFWLYNIGG